MSDQNLSVVIIGDHSPGLYLAAAFAAHGLPVTILKNIKTSAAKLNTFWQSMLIPSQVSLITIDSIKNFEKHIEGRLVIDNYSWLSDKWWQELYVNYKESAQGWVSLVPSQINEWQSNSDCCGLIFYPDFKNYPIAEVIANESAPVTRKLKSILTKMGCFLLETGIDNKFLSLAVGLHFHYLALWLAQISKFKIAEIEYLLGKTAGFLPAGIISSLKKNPYLSLLHQYNNQLKAVMINFQFVANLKDDYLLKHLPRIKSKKKIFELQGIRNEADFDERIKKLMLLNNSLASFYQYFFLQVFQWASNTVKDFSVRPDQLDAIYKYAWQWQRGPFELWNKWEPNQVLQEMEQLELAPAGWVFRLSQMMRHFYRWEASGKKILDIQKWHYVPAFVPEHLSDFKPDRVLWHKPEATITEVGENILNLEFHSKLNMMGQDAMEGIDEVLNIAAAEDYQGIVITNHGQHFTVGVNLGLVFISAIEKDYDYIQFMIEAFQKRMMQLKYAPVPVIMASHGYTIGGGAEMLLHLQNKVVAHQYARIGLVETNAGLIPGGGGSKEMSIRAVGALQEDNWDTFIHIFENIASGRINANAAQARDNGLLDQNIPVIKNRDWLLHQAKVTLGSLVQNYQAPDHNDIKVAGKAGIEILEKYIEDNKKVKKWSKKKVRLLKKAAYVFCGGDVEKNSLLQEQQLLDLEKEYFLKLCGEKYTLQQMNKILQGKK